LQPRADTSTWRRSGKRPSRSCLATQERERGPPAELATATARRAVVRRGPRL